MVVNTEPTSFAVAPEDLRYVVRLAVRDAMEQRGVSRRFQRDGDYHVVVGVDAQGVWSVRVCDDYGGLDFASVTGASLAVTLRKAIDVIGARS